MKISFKNVYNATFPLKFSRQRFRNIRWNCLFQSLEVPPKQPKISDNPILKPSPLNEEKANIADRYNK